MKTASIVWFRQDLRIQDNPALHAAIRRGRPIIPVYIWSPAEEGEWQPGGASKWWLHNALLSLENELKARQSQLIIRAGSALENLTQLRQETNADAIFWNRRYEPFAIERDRKIKESFKGKVTVESFNSSLLFEPWEIHNKEGKPFKVFTAFWKTILAKGDLRPAIASDVKTWPQPEQWPDSLALAKLQLLPKIDWAKTIRSTWQPGRAGAEKRLDIFLNEIVSNYATTRDYPGVDGVSKLSPYIHWGELSAREIWHRVKDLRLNNKNPHCAKSVETYLKELAWREFAHHLLYHFPKTDCEPLDDRFRQFPWQAKSSYLKAWQKGETGIPIVDAGMRELWATGWMHNRVRMIVASFLVKDLLIPWNDGARWFWDTLVDADLANNTLGWQWTAGCGADAAPYFRIFNPLLQSKKFDPDGDYIRTWVPELSNLSNDEIHEPWRLDKQALQRAKIVLGKNYPAPIVDHAEARLKALAAFDAIKEDRGKAARIETSVHRGNK
jgi:deoxyribodipyrimidine photo-lyase